MPTTIRDTMRRYMDALERFRLETAGNVNCAVRLDETARDGTFGRYFTAVFGDAPGAT
jgi:hypothetical protein